MSSVNFGAMSPFMDRVNKLKDMASHPLDTLSHMLTPPDQHQVDHDAAIQQMNQQRNAQAVQQANQSHTDRMRIEDQKRPLKVK